MRLLTTARLVAAGDTAREGAVNHYNDFIHHNSFRPNADAFRPDAPPSLANGNVLLVTEEDSRTRTARRPAPSRPGT